MSKSNLSSAKPSVNSDSAASFYTKLFWNIKKYSTNLSASSVVSFKLACGDDIKFRISLFKSAYCSDTYIISQFIQNATFEKYSSANYRISLIDAKEKQHFPQEDTATHKSPNGIFIFSSDSINSPNYGILTGDTLKVYCELVKLVLKDSDDKSSYEKLNQILSSYDATSRVAEDITPLLENAKFADVVLVVGKGRAKKEFRAHKNILASRSPVLGAMFEHTDTKEAQESKVMITDVFPELFKQFIRYIYTGKVAEMDKYAQDLLTLADKYQIDYLKRMCSEYLSSKLTTESVSSILVLADLHNAAELKSNCVDYIADHAQKVMATEQFAKHIKNKPDLMFELLQNQSVKRFKKE